MTAKTLIKHVLVLGIIIIVGAGPFLLALNAGLVAQVDGCTLHKGFVNLCVIWGADRGEMLYTMGMMVWYSFYIFPLASLAFMAWLVVLIIHLMRRALRKDPGSNA